MLHIGAATTIPSLVAYDQHGVVQAVGGDDTQHGAVCFYSTKRLLGLAYDDAAARVGDRMLYGIAPGPDGRAWLQVPGSDGQVLLKDTIEVTAVLLKHIVDSALGAMRDEHGVDEQLKAVVIGVPAHFSEAQRQATLQAAALAGIEGVQLLQGREREGIVLACTSLLSLTHNHFFSTSQNQSLRPLHMALHLQPDMRRCSCLTLEVARLTAASCQPLLALQKC